MKLIGLGALLVIALLAGAQGMVLPTATKATVEGYADIDKYLSVPPPILLDLAGNSHYNGVRAEGDLILHGGIEFAGRQVVELSGVLDSARTGALHGHFSATGPDKQVAWEGQFHADVKEARWSGDMVAQGAGRYAGMQLKVHMQAWPPYPGHPNPEQFDLAGSIFGQRRE